MPGASSIPPAAAADALPRLGVRDPDFWLVGLAWTVIALSCLQILLFGFGRDQGIYAVVADSILRGEMPYRDVWDFKPPGIFLLYALANAVFGPGMMAPRVLEVVGLLLLVAGLIRLSEAFVGMKRVGLMGGALAALVHAQLEFWHTGQPETFGGYFTVWALVLTVERYSGWRRWAAWAAVGALSGCAFLLKPPLGGGALVCAAYLARAEQARSNDGYRAALRPLATLALGSLVPIALCALWFRLGGAWSALRWTMLEFTPGYTSLSWEGQAAPQMLYWATEELFLKFSALNAAGFIAALIIPPMHGREREGLFLVLGISSVHLVGICMQGKFFPYHYGATLPLVALFAGVGLYKLWRRCLLGGAAGAVVFLLFLTVTAVMRTAARDLDSFWDRSTARLQYLLRLGTYTTRELLDRRLYNAGDFNLDADRQVARELRQRTPEGAFVYVWGFEPVIYGLAERPYSSRFIYNVAQRVTWGRDYARSELLEDLAERPPAMIVVQHNDVFPAVTGDNLDSNRALETFPELAQILERDFLVVTTIEDFDLYQRRPPPEG